MSNITKQLTVADLEAAKHGLLNHTNLTTKDEGVAATCIGIVEEMVKIAKSLSYNSEKCAKLWNVYNKAFAAFGGEVK